MIAKQADTLEMRNGIPNQTLDDLTTMAAAVDVVSEIDDDTRVRLGRLGIRQNSCVEAAQKIDAPVDVAHGIYTPPRRQAGLALGRVSRHTTPECAAFFAMSAGH